MTSNQKRSRLRAIRRLQRQRQGLSIRRTTPRRDDDTTDQFEKLDAVDPELIGTTEEL